jgi:PAS domain S-box-containing protein
MTPPRQAKSHTDPQQQTAARKGKVVRAKPKTEAGNPTAALEKELKAQRLALAEAQDLLEAQNEELRTAQGEIEEMLQRYASLYDDAPVGYATLDARGRIEQINLTGASLLGRERAQLVRLGFANFLVNRKERELFHDHMQRCREANEPEEVITTELQLRARGGQVRLVQLTTIPGPATEDMERCYLVAMTDITHRREAEVALRSSEERLNAVVSAAMDAILSVDEDQNLVFFNAAAERMFRRSAAEVMGQPLSLLFVERFRPGHDRHIRAFAEEGMLGELQGLRADGMKFPLEASISQTLLGDARLFTVILRDISERKVRETEELFLLQLGDHIRMAADAGGMMHEVMRMVARELQVARCFLAHVDVGKNKFTLEAGGYHAEDMPAMTETHLMSAFGSHIVQEVLAGRTVSVTDVAADARTAGLSANYQGLGIGAYVVVPLMRGGQLLAAMAMSTAERRVWSKSEVSLLSTVAERVWLALEKLRLDEALHQSSVRFQAMAEHVPVFIYTTDAAGESDFMNQRFLDYTCLSAESARGTGWMNALHPEDYAAVRRNWQSSVAERTPFAMTFRIRAADGSSRWFRCAAHPVNDERGQVTKWFGSCVDIDDLMRVQADLAGVNERLEERVMARTTELATANKELHHEFKERQRLEHEITEISEQERRSLGEALHEGVCQHLAGVVMMATTLSDVFEQKADAEMASRLKEIASLIRSAASDARDVAKGLHPVDVDADGLVAALRDLAAQFDVPGQTRCALHCSEPVPVHDNEVSMHLYRIVQEAVSNAAQHAHARKISIHLGIQQGTIRLFITDDGKGMPASLEPGEELGLKLMRYRASSIGATLTIEARAGGGTVVKCSLPAPT